MEAPVSAPASSAPASSPPPSAPASTPAPSSPPPSAPTKYGEVPKSRAAQIWADIDKAAAIKTPSEEGVAGDEAALTADQIPVAETPGTPETAAQTDAAVVDPQASPNEATLPPRLRESLKGVTDPKVRAYLADSAHMRATLQKNGLPFDQTLQFIAEAPQYLQKAPTLDVLNQIAATAEQTNAVGADFVSGTDAGHQNFTRTLLQAGPVPFVQYLGFLFNNTDNVIGGLKQNFGDALGRQVEQFRDSLMDRGTQNVIARMRSKAEEGGDFEVLSEVADELEKFVGLKERATARVQPQRADPRDLEIQRLQGEQQRAISAQRETFNSGVFNQAGNAIESKISAFIEQKGSGFTKEAKAELVKAIGTSIYEQLLNNPNVIARVKAIYQTGKWDAAHAQQLTNFYNSAADRLLGVVATPALRRMAQLTGAAMATRQQKVAAQIARKDPGASGSPPRPSVAGPPQTKNPKDIFDWYDKQALARQGAG